MKVMICYPPLNNTKGCPTLGQNRQFQYFREPTFIYPVVPATAATMLKDAGHDLLWLDCIAEGISYQRFIEIIKKERPGLIAFETKTPVIKQLWKIIDSVKCQVPSAKCALFGDHVTALSDESFENSQADFVLTGGDYDFLLLNLCNHINNPEAISLEAGIYYRENGKVRNSGKFRLDHNLDGLPFIDRDLTRWQLYAFKNGNYKRTPGTYIMSGRDCWWGKCTFCSWPTLYPQFRLRRPENVLDEIETLIHRFKIREIMDDSGTFPIGDWLKQFCAGMIKRGINKKAYLDCNMRFGALSEEDFSLMKKSGFRLLLFGLESANQATLDRLEKGVKIERIIDDCKSASKAGLFPHITIMFGYPWESFEEALKTLNLGKWLLKKGYAFTMQATLVVPYPGSPLFEECRQKRWLKTTNWDDYDMRQPVMQSSIADDKIMGLIRGMYKVSFSPEFIIRKIFSLRDTDDTKYFLRAAKKVTGHIFDFSNRRAD